MGGGGEMAQGRKRSLILCLHEAQKVVFVSEVMLTCGGLNKVSKETWRFFRPNINMIVVMSVVVMQTALTALLLPDLNRIY